MKTTILIVDDDADILTVLKANLELHGFVVRTAMSIEEARQQARVEPAPDLAVLDRMLPDGEGVELCKLWRDEQVGYPVILLTARDSVNDRVLGLDSGADDYVVKPFEPLELVARINACLRRVRPGAAQRLSIGYISVDKGSMVVTVRGEPIELTPKEFQLLCLFMENVGQVLSRETIRKSLWKDAQIYSWSRVIDVHVQHLRQKIEQDPANPAYLKTILGTGYKFEAPAV